jgi:hypothetical protein
VSSSQSLTGLWELIGSCWFLLLFFQAPPISCNSIDGRKDTNAIGWQKGFKVKKIRFADRFDVRPGPSTRRRNGFRNDPFPRLNGGPMLITPPADLSGDRDRLQGQGAGQTDQGMEGCREPGNESTKTLVQSKGSFLV